MESEPFPDNALFQCIRPRQVNTEENTNQWVKARALLNMPDARRFVEYGEYMLYLVCANANAPLDIVKAIYSISPGQAFYEDHLLGHTPLHNACLYGSIEIMTFLIEVAPELTVLGRHSLPLHKMILCRNNNVKKIQKLLQLHPFLAQVKDQMGKTPIEIFCESWNSNDNPTRKWWAFSSTNTNIDDIFIHTLTYEEFITSRAGHNAMETFFMLLRANKKQKGSKDKQLQFPLHEAINMKGIPSSLLKFLLRRFPEEMYKRDEHGNYILHIALTNRDLEPKILEFIIESNQEAVQRVNKQGRLPLAIAIEYGILWENNGILRLLLRVYPDAISNPDIQTQLYPFMTALSSEKASMSLVYNLLQMDPSIVSIGIPFRVVGKMALQ